MKDFNFRMFSKTPTEISPETSVSFLEQIGFGKVCCGASIMTVCGFHIVTRESNDGSPVRKMPSGKAEKKDFSLASLKSTEETVELFYAKDSPDFLRICWWLKHHNLPWYVITAIREVWEETRIILTEDMLTPGCMRVFGMRNSGDNVLGRVFFMKPGIILANGMPVTENDVEGISKLLEWEPMLGIYGLDAMSDPRRREKENRKMVSDHRIIWETFYWKKMPNN